MQALSFLIMSTDLMKSIKDLDESKFIDGTISAYILGRLKYAMNEEYKEYRKKKEEAYKGCAA